MKNSIFLLLCLISLPTVAQTTTCNLGNQSSTGFTNAADPIYKGYLLGIKFTLTTPGILTSLNLIGRNTSANVKMALYEDVSGKPGDLVDSTSIGIVKSGVLSLPVTQQILPAGDYWIMAIYSANGGHTYSKTEAGNKIYYKTMDFGATIPSNASDFTAYQNSTFTYFLGITCGTSLAVSNANNSSIINFYPNPASDVVTLNTHPNLVGETYRITTISGTQIATGQLTSETNVLDINSLQAGIYFMIIGDRQRETIKFVKQ